MTKDVFVIQPPKPDDPGNYFLMVTSGSGFDQSRVVFSVDEVVVVTNEKGEAHQVQGQVNGVVVVAFPPMFPYLLVPKTSVRNMSALAMAKEQRRASKAFEKAFPQPTDTATPAMIEALGQGQYL